MEAPVEKEEMGVTINMDNGENNFVGELVDEPVETLIRKPSKKELDREEGRRGNERKPSNKVTYHPVSGRSDSAPSVPYRPGVARGSYRPTGVLGYVNPEKEDKSRRRSRSRDEFRPKDGRESFRHFEDREENRRPRRSRDFEERDSRRLEEHEKRMSMLEASLHELYPTSAITVQKNQEEDPVPSIKKWTNDDIPMEKFQTDGVSQLSESELLAIIKIEIGRASCRERV